MKPDPEHVARLAAAIERAVEIYEQNTDLVNKRAMYKFVAEMVIGIVPEPRRKTRRASVPKTKKF